MQKHWTNLALALMVIFAFTACTKKKISSEAATTTPAGTEAQTRQRTEEEARQNALREETLREERLKAEQAQKQKQTERSVFENEDIYFEFDSIRLSPEAQEILTQKAAWLRKNPNVRVTIEGHCDDRGTNEYNLALGEGRAQSAQTFLVDLGIDASRMITLSYGEERPIAIGQDEASWARNRRVHFVIEE